MTPAEIQIQELQTIASDGWVIVTCVVFLSLGLLVLMSAYYDRKRRLSATDNDVKDYSEDHVTLVSTGVTPDEGSVL